MPADVHRLLLVSGAPDLPACLLREVPLELEQTADVQEAASRLTLAPRAYEAAVIDGRGGGSGRIVAWLRSRAPELGLVVVADTGQQSDVERELRFTPFTGSSATFEVLEAGPELAAAALRAAEGTRRARQLRATLESLDQQLRTAPAAPQAAPEYLGRLLEVAPIGVVELDEEGRVRSLNARAAAILGLETRQTGVDLPALLADELPADDSPRLVARTRGAEEQHLEITCTAIHRPSGGPGRLVVLQDVTARVVLEQEVRAAATAKDAFLTMLAHELRNPLAPILTSLELLTLTADLQPAAARARAIIERQVRHLARIVDDLLDESRLARGLVEIRRAPLDLVELVRTAAEDRRPEMEAAGLTLSMALPAEPLSVQGDATRLTQVLGNVLANAIKFTDRGGHVLVSLTRNGTDAELSVCDDGIGMAPAVLRSAFDTFTQGDSSLARTRGGLGLGLAVVKRLVELHGGSVRATSEGPGRGSEVVVSLPLSEEL